MSIAAHELGHLAQKRLDRYQSAGHVLPGQHSIFVDEEVIAAGHSDVSAAAYGPITSNDFKVGITQEVIPRVGGLFEPLL